MPSWQFVQYLFHSRIQHYQPLQIHHRLLFSKVYNDIKEGIKGISASLKVGAEHVYDVMVKQQVINAATDTMFSLLLIIITLSGWITFKKSLKHYEKGGKWQNEDKGEHVETVLPLVVGIIMTLVTLIYIGTHVSIILTGFFNPEYGAIKDISNFIKN